jgi:hypothetical protein
LGAKKEGLRSLLSRDPLGVTAQRKSPAAAFGVWRVFLFLHSRIQTAFDAQLEIKNPGTDVPGLLLRRQEV